MKSVTIPLTERQVGWILFCVVWILLDYFFVWSTITFKTIELFYPVIPLNIAYVTFAFMVDGRYDVNPIHWIGYCLKLKEQSSRSDKQ